MDMDMDGKFHIHGNPGNSPENSLANHASTFLNVYATCIAVVPR